MDTLDNVPDGWQVTIEVDDDPANPRDMSDDPIHVLTVPDRDYGDVDRNPGPWGPQWRDLLGRYDWSKAIEIMMRYARLTGGYAHESAPHDGPRSVWYLTREDAADWTDPQSALAAYADEYAAWRHGEVYGYVIRQRVAWQRVDNSEVTEDRWEIVDSCWGYYGGPDGHVEQAAREALAALVG